MSYQALVVSQELIRVAILWHEMWHEALEEASRLYFTDHNPDGMIAHLEPFHDTLEKVVSVIADTLESFLNRSTGSQDRARDLIRTSVWPRPTRSLRGMPSLSCVR